VRLWVLLDDLSHLIVLHEDGSKMSSENWTESLVKLVTLSNQELYLILTYGTDGLIAVKPVIGEYQVHLLQEIIINY